MSTTCSNSGLGPCHHLSTAPQQPLHSSISGPHSLNISFTRTGTAFLFSLSFTALPFIPLDHGQHLVGAQQNPYAYRTPYHSRPSTIWTNAPLNSANCYFHNPFIFNLDVYICNNMFIYITICLYL